jgi:hypothetical protein
VVDAGRQRELSYVIEAVAGSVSIKKLLLKICRSRFLIGSACLRQRRYARTGLVSLVRSCREDSQQERTFLYGKARLERA